MDSIGKKVNSMREEVAVSVGSRKGVTNLFVWVLSMFFVAAVICGLLLPTEAKAATIASSICGNNLTWTLTDDGTLTISGTGPMSTYDEYPWDVYGSDIISVVIEDGATSVGSFAFASYNNLERVTISGSVKSIGDDAFGQCPNLTYVKLGDGVNSIGEGAFRGCMGLTTVTIPNSVTSIGDYAFSGSDSIETVYCFMTSGSIGKYAFSWMKSGSTIYAAKPSLLTADTHYTASNTNVVFWVNGTCGDNLTWSLTDDGTLTISGTGAMTNYSYGSVPWYSWRTSITEVVIEDGVTSIGGFAFYNCTALTSVTIPGSVTSIGDDVFLDCPKLSIIVDTSNANYSSIDGVLYNKNKTALLAWPSAQGNITIPAGVTSIETGVFSGCCDLESVSLPDSLTSIGDEAFSCCCSLTEIIIPNSVTSIGDGAFTDCYGFTSVTIPSSVTSIGECAFYFCNNLTEVTIPSSVTRIGNEAFLECYSLLHIYCYMTSGSVGDDAFFDIDSDSQIYAANAALFEDGVNYNSANTTIFALAGDCGENLTWSLDFASGTLTISGTGDMYYWGVENGAPWYDVRGSITSVVLPEGLTSVGAHAFVYCRYLTSIDIPNGVTSIGSKAFFGCSNLVDVIIPDSVVSIGSTAFMACSSLAEISIPRSVMSIGNSAFLDLASGSTIYVASSNASLLVADTNYTASKTSVSTIESGPYGDNLTWVLKDGLLTISGTGAMNDSDDITINESWHFFRPSITAVIIEDGITSIGADAFFNCANLTSVVIPNSVISIGDYAFYNCTGLTSVTIPSSVTSIGQAAFYECTGLTSVTIPNSVTSIGQAAFGLTALAEVVIPNSVAEIGEGVFGGSPNLTSITVNAENSNYCSDNGVLYNKDKTALIQYPAGKVDTSFTVPNSVTSIGMGAFIWSVNLESIYCYMGNGTIGELAFLGIAETSTIYTANKSLFTPYDEESGTGNYNATTTTLLGIYTVTFEDHNGNVLKTEAVFEGNSAVAPDAATVPARVGYTFTGWDKTFSNITADTTVTAQYAIRTDLAYTVEYVDGQGNAVAEPKTVTGQTFGASVTEDAVAIDGYTVDASSKSITISTGENKITFTYTLNTYTVTFKDHDGTQLKTQTVSHGSAATAPADPARTGYTFTGWDKTFSNIMADTTVTAQYAIRTDLAYTVEYREGSESGNVLRTAKTVNNQTFGASVTEDAVAIDGYTVDASSKSITISTAENKIVFIYSKRADCTYIVEYVDKQGNAVAESKTVAGQTFGASVTETAVSVVGYTADNASKSITISTGENKITFTYTLNTYTVTFKDHDGTVLKTETVNHGDNATVPTEPIRDGYTFSGWDKAYDNITADTTVTAQYSIRTNLSYTVEYREGSESGNVLRAAKTVNNQTFGASVTEDAVAIDGYTVDASSKSITISTAENKLVFIYSKRADLAYTVAYVDGQGNAVAEPKTVTGQTFGASVTENAVAIDGYTVDDAFKSITISTGENKITFTYTLNTYTVTFKDHDGTQLKTQTVSHGSAATAPADPSRAGYTFTGWDKTFSNITADTTVTAQYAINSYTVTYQYSNSAPAGAGSVPEGGTYEFGESVLVAGVPTVPDGYVFSGWSTTDTTISDGSFMMPAKSVVLTGAWTVKGDTPYVVEHYQQNLDKSYSLIDTEHLTGATAATATANPKFYEGFSLNSSHDEYLATATIKGDGTTVLKLFYSRNSYVVTFKDFDGTVIGEEQPILYGGAATAPAAPSRTGHTFTGWDKVFSNVTADTTVTAQYSVNSYTVTWIVDGAENEESCNYGDEIIPPEDPGKDGYFFVGWEGYTPGMIMGEANISFTALWEEVRVTITENPDGSKVTVMEDAIGNKTVITERLDGSSTTVETKKDGTVITTDDDAEGNTISVTEKPDGTTVTKTEDAEGNTTEVTEQVDGTTITKTEDAAGNKCEVTENADGSMSSVEEKADGTVITTNKDTEGNTTEVTEQTDGTTITKTEDSAGNKSEVTENADGSMSSVEEKADGTVITTNKDTAGNITEVTEQTDGTTITKAENAATGDKTTITEEPSGDKTTVEEKADGTIITTTEDTEGNKSQVTEQTDGTTITKTEDSVGNKSEVTENADGSMSSVEEKADGTVITTNKDTEGNTTEVTEQADGTTITKTEDVSTGDKTTITEEVSGDKTTVEEKADGTVITTTEDSEGNTTEVTEQTDGTTITKAENAATGDKTTITEEVSGDKTTVEEKADGTVITTTEDSEGNKSQVTEQVDGTTITKTENAATGEKTTITVEVSGDKTTVEEKADGTIITTTEDTEGNKSQVTEQTDGTTITKTEDSAGNKSEVTENADGSMSSVEEKADGTVITTNKDAEGNTTEVVKYTVSFKDYDGTIISSVTYLYGEAVTVPSNPSRESDETNIYVFACWSPSISEICEGNVTYTATYTSTPKDNVEDEVFTIEFRDWNGVVISSNTYHHGDTVIEPALPTRTSDADYSYACSGWNTPVTTVSRNAVYVAMYDRTYIGVEDKKDIVYVDNSGSVITQEEYEQGGAVVPPEAPDEGTLDENLTSEFAGWEVTTDSTGKDVFIPTYSVIVSGTRDSYTFVFEDFDGEEVLVTIYGHGDVVEMPAPLERQEDAAAVYIFAGWRYSSSFSMSPMARMRTTDNYIIVYTANYLSIPKSYTVTFLGHDGSVLDCSVYHYGDAVTVPTPPTRDGYTFAGWDVQPSDTCVGDATYTATYTQNVVPGGGTPGGSGVIGGGTSSGGGSGNDSAANPEVPIPESIPGGNVTVPEDVKVGDTVSPIVKPEPGYVLDKVIVTDKDGKPVDVTINPDGSFSFVMPEGGVTIEVSFKTASTVEDCDGTDCPVSQYTDIKHKAWYHDGVHYCLEQGLMNGLPDNKFGPNGKTTRAQVVTVLWRLAGSPDVASVKDFTDMAEAKWAKKAILWAAETGITGGYGDGRFGPNDAITREQLATFLYRFLGVMGYELPEPEETVELADMAEVSGWAKKAVTAICGAGVIQGTPEKEISPQGKATRAQTAVMLYRFAMAVQ